MNIMPYELIIIVAGLLPLADLSQLRLTSRIMNELTHQVFVGKLACERRPRMCKTVFHYAATTGGYYVSAEGLRQLKEVISTRDTLSTPFGARL